MTKWFKKYRTMILGLLALCLLVGSAVKIFEVPWYEMREFIIGAFLFVGLITLCALAAAIVMTLLRRR